MNITPYIQYIYFGCSQKNGEFIIYLQPEIGSYLNREAVINNENEIWSATFEVFTALTGFRENDIKPSKWSNKRDVLKKTFFSPIWDRYSWKSFNAKILFRPPKNVVNRGQYFDLDFDIEIDIRLSSNPHEIRNWEEDFIVYDRSSALKIQRVEKQIHDSLTALYRVMVDDKNLELHFISISFDNRTKDPYKMGFFVRGNVV